MGLSCGLIGLPRCGKTTVFNAITAAGAGSYTASEMNRAVVNVPEPWVDALVGLYHPPKVVPATLEVVDIPGLSEGSTATDGRGTRLLSHIKEVDALLHVVRCFEDQNVPFVYDTIGPARDVETIDLEMMVADSRTLERKIERLSKRVRAGDKDAVRESTTCGKVLSALNDGIPVRRQELSSQELKDVFDCNLVSLKPVLYVANVKSADDFDNEHVKALGKIASSEGAEMVAICGKDEAEIAGLDPTERIELLELLGLEAPAIERLIHAAYRTLGLVSFFTAGPKEVHAWTCRKGDAAPVAAGKIHTDMEKGFIRMEVIRVEDLIELGSEEAAIRAGRRRIVGKDYEVQDGDVVVVRFSPKR